MTTAINATAVPLVDLQRQHAQLGNALEEAVAEVLHAGRYVGGEAVAGFERQLAAELGVAECASCNSGTDALYLALRALGIGSGDEVITTPFTFIATAEAIAAAGATPVFVDIEPGSFNLDLSQLEAAIGPRTRVVLPVHLFGQPVNMTRLLAIARAHRLYTIEDCAQAAGAQWQGYPVGSLGDVGCFSFFPTKNLGACGDGGAITTNDPALAARFRQLADHGREQGYYHTLTGTNSRLDTLQAAILQVKLPYLARWNQQRRELAAGYQRALRSRSELGLPREPAGGRGVWNQYTVRVPGSDRRDRLRQALHERGIGTAVYYPLPLHRQPAYAHLGYRPGQLPAAERAAREVLSLPLFPGLTAQEQQHVAACLHASWQALAA